MTRRVTTLAGALLLAAAFAGGGFPTAAAAAPSPAAPTTGQPRSGTPIEHFVMLMQEGHSFDNYFGTYPGADGIPAATCMPAPPAACVTPFHVGGHSVVDMGNSATLVAAQYHGGKMDGFVSAFSDRQDVGTQAMGYYDDRDIPYYWNIADNYVLFDRFFSSATGGSFRNHMFWVTGTPGNAQADTVRATGFDDVPTIFDRLQAAGVSWKFYVQNYRPAQTFRSLGTGTTPAQVVRVPLLNDKRFLDDPTLHSRIVDMSQYYKDLRAGTLPAVSFMVPSSTGEHPPGNIQSGQRMVRSLISALMSSSAWNSSAFLWTYDNSGGWYDHVVPPAVDRYGYGPRTPALLVSPYALPGHVDHTTLDFTSALKFIETNWGVPPLAVRDRNAANLTSAFDFTAPPRPPLLLGLSRAPERQAVTRTGAVYLYYGLAAAGFAALLAAGVVTGRRRARKAVT